MSASIARILLGIHLRRGKMSARTHNAIRLRPSPGIRSQAAEFLKILLTSLC